MVKHILSAFLILILAVSFSTVTFAQGQAKTEAKKVDKKEMKAEKTSGPLKSVSCPPECGFMCKSHDEKELSSIMKNHAKKSHNMTMTDKEVKGMMKAEEAAGSYK